MTDAAPPPSLQDVHDGLIAMIDQLDAAVGQATTKAQVTTLLNQIDDLTAQATAVGAQLLHQQLGTVADALKDVAAAQADALAAAKQAAKTQALITAAADYIDKVGALLKLL